MIFMNPNPGSGVKASKILNDYSTRLRKEDFFTKFVKSEGFDINPIDFTWEYIIEFKNRSGFLVFREIGLNTLKLFVYPSANSLRPKQFIIKNAIPIDGVENGLTRLLKLIKEEYRKLK